MRIYTTTAKEAARLASGEQTVILVPIDDEGKVRTYLTGWALGKDAMSVQAPYAPGDVVEVAEADAITQTPLIKPTLRVTSCEPVRVAELGNPAVMGWNDWCRCFGLDPKRTANGKSPTASEAWNARHPDYPHADAWAWMVKVGEGMTPTARTLAHLRKHGVPAAVVERYCHHTRRRHDLFGIIDIVALRDGQTVGIQATSGSNHSSRVEKCRESEALPGLLHCGWSVEVWSWRKLKVKRGGKAVRWTPRIEVVDDSNA